MAGRGCGGKTVAAGQDHRELRARPLILSAGLMSVEPRPCISVADSFAHPTTRWFDTDFNAPDHRTYRSVNLSQPTVDPVPTGKIYAHQLIPLAPILR